MSSADTASLQVWRPADAHLTVRGQASNECEQWLKLTEQQVEWRQ